MESMEAGLERLRASRDANDEQWHARGVGLGKQWATDEAEYDQLERVAARNTQEGGFANGEPWSKPWLLQLVEAVYGDEDIAREQHDEFAEKWFNRIDPPDAMLNGFVEGAAEIYNVV